MFLKRFLFYFVEIEKLLSKSWKVEKKLIMKVIIKIIIKTIII